MTIAFQPPRDGAFLVVDLDRHTHGESVFVNAAESASLRLTELASRP
jgi:hypothetical protein